jgi:hypothetical protein
MRKLHWFDLIACLWFAAGLSGAVFLWTRRGLVPLTGGDCLRAPCYTMGHPHILLGTGVLIVAIGGPHRWWSAARHRPGR